MKPKCIVETTGLRKEGTEPGSWNGAWVACRDNYGNVTMAVFEDNMDFINSSPCTWEEVLEQKKKLYEEEKWVPMTREDIEQTAGI